MSDPIEQIRAIFLSPDVDEETRADNEQKIIEWQQALIRNEAYQAWRESDITKEIATTAKRIYKDASMILATSRSITEMQRFRLWAEQDAAKLILTLVNEDAQAAIDTIHKEIQAAINATN